MFKNGRKLVEPDAKPTDVPTMPIEFSVAAFRLGHSMIRAEYNWNSHFPGTAGTLDWMFLFSALGGDLARRAAAARAAGSPTGAGCTTSRPPASPALAAPDSGVNMAMRIDTRLTDPLSSLPPSTFGGDDNTPELPRNLAFRNLTRGNMVKLASGQQMVTKMKSLGIPVTPLTRAQILNGNGGAKLDHLTAAEKNSVATRTPLWFYILREAELNNGRLKGVGARIVAETFHRAMEGSRFSIVRTPGFKPDLGPRPGHLRDDRPAVLHLRQQGRAGTGRLSADTGDLPHRGTGGRGKRQGPGALVPRPLRLGCRTQRTSPSTTVAVGPSPSRRATAFDAALSGWMSRLHV